jgi:hypothetical protein
MIARDEIPHLVESLAPGSPPTASVLSAVRRLSGATLFNPAAAETLAQRLGFPYLPLDGIAINPEIGFLFLRTGPGKNGDAREGRPRTLLLWEIAKDVFHGVPLLTDTVEVVARMYGERPKSRPGPQPSPTRPRRSPASSRRARQTPK